MREFQCQEVFKRYRAATLTAAKETGIALHVFPEECPFTPEQALDLEYFPENPEAE